MNGNNITLVGRLTKDVEIKQVGNNNVAIADFGIAVNEKRKEKEITHFFTCKAIGSKANACADNLKTGVMVIVSGSLQFEQWEKDGKKFSKTVVLVEEIGRVIFKKESGQQAHPQQQSKQGGDAI